MSDGDGFRGESVRFKVCDDLLEEGERWSGGWVEGGGPVGIRGGFLRWFGGREGDLEVFEECLELRNMD